MDETELDRAVLRLACDEIRRDLGGPRAAAEPATTEPAGLDAPAGCFVSLHRRDSHALRGCIGRIEATCPLGDAVRDAARSTLRDPRFADDPVTAAELPELEIEVSVLAPPRRARGVLAFDPPNEGIILEIGRRRGVFLPQVARETGWTREQLLDRLCSEKLGLPPDAWKKPGAILETFAARVIGPVAFGEC